MGARSMNGLPQKGESRNSGDMATACLVAAVSIFFGLAMFSACFAALP
jgi:hypothetical protein